MWLVVRLPTRQAKRRGGEDVRRWWQPRSFSMSRTIGTPYYIKSVNGEWCCPKTGKPLLKLSFADLIAKVREKLNRRMRREGDLKMKATLAIFLLTIFTACTEDCVQKAASSISPRYEDKENGVVCYSRRSDRKDLSCVKVRP